MKRLRTMFLIIMAMNFLFTVRCWWAFPVLADKYLPEGAVAFGLLMSAYAGGNLTGYLLPGRCHADGKSDEPSSYYHAGAHSEWRSGCLGSSG